MKRFLARLRGDHRGVADEDFAAGRLQSAARFYARAGDYVAAAKAAAAAGDEEQALALARRIANAHDAGVLLASEGLDRLAVNFFEECGAFWQAAECALRSKQVLRAARLYESAGALERSADAFEKAGALEETLRVLQLESERRAESTDSGAQRRVDLRRAKLLSRLGRAEEAAAVLTSCGQHLSAAELWLKQNNFVRAAEAFLAAGSSHRAVALVEELEEADPELRARVLSAADRHAEAADIYAELGQVDLAIEQWEACGDYAQAADGFRQNGMFDRAADLFYRAGDYDAAAACYRQAGNPRAAANALRECGKAHDAGALFLEADDPLRAAEAFAAADDRDSAIAALRAVGPEHADFAVAAMKLAPILVSERLYSEAIELLEARTLTGGLNQDQAQEISYWRARAHEGAGEIGAASRAYRRLSRGPGFMDSSERLVRIQTDRSLARTSAEATDASPVQLSPGAIIDSRWEVIEEIGRGGTSRVFRAFDRRRSEEVALKILLDGSSDRITAEERLLTEARIGRRLNHPSVLRVFDVGRFSGCLFVTMELMQGRTLERILQEEGRLPLSVAHALITEIVAGLEAAHEEGILHRDLKPSNVAVSPNGVRLMDFGIAFFVDRDLSLTQTGQVIGSPMYMSPEQIQGSALDRRTDLYSLGVLIYTMLTGLEPFQGKTATIISLKHLQDEPPDPRDQRPELPEQWSQLVRWLLNKQRENRPDSASVVAAALASLPH